jgi:hypothetical protein
VVGRIQAAAANDLSIAAIFGCAVTYNELFRGLASYDERVFIISLPLTKYNNKQSSLFYSDLGNRWLLSQYKLFLISRMQTTGLETPKANWERPTTLEQQRIQDAVLLTITVHFLIITEAQHVT